MDQTAKLLLNSVRIRIIQLLAGEKTMTVTQMADQMSDIPRSSIYRHVHLLHENKILRIEKEEKIRGTYEREYALNADCLNSEKERIEERVSEMLLKLMSDFGNYFRQPGNDAVKDKLFFSVNTLLMSDQEFEIFQEEMFAVVKKYLNQPADKKRTTRNLSIISSPAQGERPGRTK